MLAEELLNRVRQYVDDHDLGLGLGAQDERNIDYLAQGEYNLNYLLTSGPRRYVLRINTGSQMQLDNQIGYEYQALQLLSRSSVTPQVYYLDDSRQEIPYGLLIMEYLPGTPLDYCYDLAPAARTLAKIHGLEFSQRETEFLVKEPGPFTGIYNEAQRLLEPYFASPEANPQAARRLERFFAKAGDRKREEQFLLNEPWLRVINTEVNSHNFIVNSEQGKCFLIDWEKPILGEPAQDLAHFLIATTTLWKRNYLLSKGEEELFLTAYLKALPPVFQAKTLPERVEMFKFFIYLRAVSWCAMAYTEYIKPGRPLSNQDTFEKIKQFLEPEFLDRITG